MSEIENVSEEWIGSAEAAQILSIEARKVSELAKRGLLVRRLIPGSLPKYLRSDVERLAREATKPATVSIA